MKALWLNDYVRIYRKKKKTLKEKAREQTKTKLQMVIHGDQPDLPMEEDLFSLARMKRIAKQMADELASVAIANYDDEDDKYVAGFSFIFYCFKNLHI